ncbi:FAD/NAD(P)-binding protein [Marinobacter sp.]|uniref:FAD/NAD(P)-binding protein n=1 Tax=Marinobacter sp. TaxID=50741 RepID=UPI00384B06B6
MVSSAPAGSKEKSDFSAAGSRMPMSAEVIDRIEESGKVFTLRLRLSNPEQRHAYRFEPGQFNMLYLHGVGEVAISIASDPSRPGLLGHTIRRAGRVTEAMARLPAGGRVGLRGPFGRPWPLSQAEGSDVLVITGGLGCAPVVGVINYVLKHRQLYGKLTIIQGVKHAEDLIWQDQYNHWRTMPNTQVLLAADHGGPLWPFHVGMVTEVFDKAHIDPADTTVMMCGPEPMMIAGVNDLLKLGLSEQSIYLSMERNMQCAVGHCGHCMFGAQFVCRQGPIFNYPDLKALLGTRGF